MKKILTYGAFGLLAVGLFFGRYLGRWIVNVIDNPDTRINNGKPHVVQYLNDCDTLHLIMKNSTLQDTFFKVQGAFDLSRDDNTASVDKYETIFYEEKMTKYFCIYYFFSRNSMFSQMYYDFIYDINKNGAHIIATVNKKELADITYGTKQKPIPITYFETPDNSTTLYDLNKGSVENKFTFHGTEAEFKTYMKNYNIRNYLSYVKSKADFEKMFGKQQDK
ncbi:hypothetical protein [Pedobacter cryoconitis]|uniref:DUF8188 domain-containing protein n=1 Tax=Pedobacter cryoconitis TaxID=188932 RepID=A0A327T283_9SPHI|nr:hypothetical protein [Pedobacter cryoconitis]RAJ31877.1 hypothetical protein LY11_02034 [Pedobacter cryoconitis]